MRFLEKQAVQNEQKGLITAGARAFLVGYARDELCRPPRPSSYPWLQHRWQSQVAAPLRAVAPARDCQRPHRVVVLVRAEMRI